VSITTLTFANWPAGLAYFKANTAPALAKAPADDHSSFCYANAAKRTITCNQIWKVLLLFLGSLSCRATPGICFADRQPPQSHARRSTQTQQQDKASADAYFKSPSTLARVAALKPYLAPTNGVVTTFEKHVLRVLRFVN
jgi:hypothetical protein